MNRFRPQKREDSTRINNEIRAPRIRLIGAAGEAVGIMTVSEALIRANEAKLDLVEIAPLADPPVCRIMDYGKFKYEKSKKAKEAKKKQHVVHLKEIKLHPKTDEHDFNFKKDHARKFLLKGDRVKATVVFRGREITHIDFGKRVLERMDECLSDLAQIEVSGKMEGRNMTSIYVPDKIKINEFNRKQETERKKEKSE
ncbi:MAG TPA: translation initiation factor IF-3 [Chitinispirillaceae bacterium]|nr:translation initiation factor IF-3 [Chitinispirillaceae bacterium]